MSELHDPLPPSAAVRLRAGTPPCAFVTAGPRAYAPAMSCVAKRLEAVGSRFPLLTFVEEEDEAYMREHVYASNHSQSAVLPWRAFPTRVTGLGTIGIRGARTMDKMNLLGLSALRRVVWIDADAFVRENIDALCELPERVRFAAALNAHSGRPTYVWPSRHSLRSCIYRFNRRCERLRLIAMITTDYH